MRPLGVAEREVQVREVHEEEADAPGGSCDVGCGKTRQRLSVTRQVAHATSCLSWAGGRRICGGLVVPEGKQPFTDSVLPLLERLRAPAALSAGMDP